MSELHLWCTAEVTQEHYETSLALLLTLLLSALLFAQARTAHQSLVLTHFTVIDMTGVRPKSDQTVIITSDRIVAVGKSGEIVIPQNALVVEATGKFLIQDRGICTSIPFMAKRTIPKAPYFRYSLLMVLLAYAIWDINSLDQVNKWRQASAVEI